MGTDAIAESGYRRYFLLFDLCAFFFLGTMALSYSGSSEAFTNLLALGWMALLLFLFIRRKRDEFAQHCWTRATEAAFVMLVAATIFWAFGVGFYDGITDSKSGLDLPPDQIIDIVFATFFAAFEWARFRGSGE